MANLKFKPVPKDQLFYNQYKYCIRFRLPEVSVLRKLDHSAIDSVLDSRIDSRKTAAKRYATYKNKHGAGSPFIRATSWREITQDTRSALHTVADLLIATEIQYKLVVSIDLAWVYTNDTELIQQLQLLPVYAKKYSQAVVNRAKNTVLLKRPKHKNRSYFKSVVLSPREKSALVTFLNNNIEEIRMSPSLLEWSCGGEQRTQEYFFVDHDGPQWLTLFGLIRSGLIKKTCDIILDK